MSVELDRIASLCRGAGPIILGHDAKGLTPYQLDSVIMLKAAEAAHGQRFEPIGPGIEVPKEVRLNIELAMAAFKRARPLCQYIIDLSKRESGRKWALLGVHAAFGAVAGGYFFLSDDPVVPNNSPMLPTVTVVAMLAISLSLAWQTPVSESEKSQLEHIWDELDGAIPQDPRIFSGTSLERQMCITESIVNYTSKRLGIEPFYFK
jgi:hypothetical protein